MSSSALSGSTQIFAPQERRRTPREEARLPILLRAEGRDLPARLIDVSVHGAQVETSVPVGQVRVPFVLLSCGTVQVQASIVWTRGCRLGLRFSQRIAPESLQRLLQRAKLIELRKIVRNS